MTNTAEPERPEEPPVGRDAALRAAILRIGSSLDVDTVLVQVVESARALTGARYGDARDSRRLRRRGRV